MLDLKVIFETGVAIMVFMVAAGAGFGGLWYAFRSKELKKVKEDVAVNKELLEECEGKHVDNQAAIANLQGQIDAYSKLSLVPNAFLESVDKKQNDIIRILEGKRKGEKRKAKKNEPK